MFKRIAKVVVMLAIVLMLSFAMAQGAVASPVIQVGEQPQRVVKGRVIPDQTRFAGPETRIRFPKTTGPFTVIGPGGGGDCWASPSTANCDNVDPSLVWVGGHKCSDDAITVVSAFAYDSLNGNQDMLVEERWSPHCQANWTRVSSFVDKKTVSLQADLFAQDHSSIDYSASCGNGCTMLWNNMYYAPTENVNSQGTITVRDVRCCFYPNYQLQATARTYN